MKAFPNKQMTNFHHISNVGGEVVTSTNTLFKVSDELQFLIDIRYQHVTMLEASDDDLIFRNSSFFHLLPSNFLLIFRGWDGGERKVVECTHMKREEKDKKKRFKDSKKKWQCIIVVYNVGSQWHSSVVQFAAQSSFPLSMRSLWYVLRKEGIMMSFDLSFENEMCTIWEMWKVKRA